MKKISIQAFPFIGRFTQTIKKFITTFNITFNYTFICIILFLLLTFILIQFIGSNILSHEAYVLKKDFIEDNKDYTRDLADTVRKYIESLDNVAILDFIDSLAKERKVIYAYVLNANKEVIAHSVKSELFRKYEDKFTDKKHLLFFLKNSDKVWTQEGVYKKIPVIKFSKPIILQFAKKDIMDTLKLSDGIDDSSNKDDNVSSFIASNQAEVKESIQTNTSKTNKKGAISNKSDKDDLSKRFYLAGSLHVAFSTETLIMIKRFSRGRMQVYYFIAYLIAVLFGYLLGKHLDRSISRSQQILTAFYNDTELEPIDTTQRVDSFKFLYDIINKIIKKFKTYSDTMTSKIETTSDVYFNVLSRLSLKSNLGIIIVDKYLRVEYINDLALKIMGKEKSQVIQENITTVFDKDIKVADASHKLIESGSDASEISVDSKNKFYLLYPILYHNEVYKVLIFINPDFEPVLSEKEEAKKTKKKVEEPIQEKKEDQEKPASQESIASSRLKRM